MFILGVCTPVFVYEFVVSPPRAFFSLLALLYCDVLHDAL